jgi:N-acetylmuramoyl-L-alanine amidase
MRRPALGVLAVCLGLAGCGGDDPDVPSAAPTVGQTPTTTAPRSPLPPSLGGAEGRPPRAEAAAPVRRPPIVQMRIPYGSKRRADMAAYSFRHYGDREWRLRPRAIVEHWTQNSSVRATYEIFRPNRRDPELQELPGTCSHYVIAASGTIYQLVPDGVRCRHAFGVNHVALGIEHVGFSDSQVMGNRRQLAASLALTRWLACRYGIATRDVIGHAETLRSRFYTERHPERYGRDTHDDFDRRTMTRYRRLVAARPCR